MPIYEYMCKDCGKEFEIKQSISDTPLDICPECKGRLQRKISGGSGFILTQKENLTRCGSNQTCCGSPTSCTIPPCEK